MSELKSHPEGVGLPGLLPEPPSRLNALQGAMLALGLLLVAMVAAFPVPVVDLWWQLKAGELILNTRSIPNADIFSFTANGEPWILQEWLTEVLFYVLYTSVSPLALVGYKVAGATLAFALVFWRCWMRSRHFLLSLALTVLGAYAARYFFDIRPQVLTYVCMALLLLLLDGERSGRWPWALWGVPPLFLFWANCHAAFLLGLVVLGAELATAGVTAWLQRDLHCPRLRILAVTTVLSAVVALANPSGFHVYLYPFTLLTHDKMLDMVAEWSSPDFHLAWLRPYEALILLLVGSLGISRGRSALADRIIAIGLLHASLSSMRHVPLFAIFAAPLIAEQLSGAMAGATAWLRAQRVERIPVPVLATALAGGLLLLGLSHEWKRIPKHDWFGYSAQMSYFPTRACDFLMEQDWDPRLLHYYGWGGYLIWRLHPKYQVFIDGRAEVYFRKAFDDFTHITECRPGWDALLDEWRINTVLMPPNSGLARVLPALKKWQVVYRDEQAVILRRPGPTR